MRIDIEVVTPGNGKTYEIILDDTLTVGVAKEKIIEQIVAFENGNIMFDEKSEIFSPSTHSPLPDYRNLRAAGIKSGQSIYIL